MSDKQEKPTAGYVLQRKWKIDYPKLLDGDYWIVVDEPPFWHFMKITADKDLSCWLASQIVDLHNRSLEHQKVSTPQPAAMDVKDSAADALRAAAVLGRLGFDIVPYRKG